MATLQSKSITFKLAPCQLEFAKEQWLETALSLQFKVGSQSMSVQPARKITILRDNYSVLIEGVRSFLRTLCDQEDDLDLLHPIEPFVFVPLELDFEFACLNGDVGSDGDGEVTVRIMVNLETVAAQFTSEYAGATVNVSAGDLRAFTDQLETEVAKAVGEVEDVAA